LRIMVKPDFLHSDISEKNDKNNLTLTMREASSYLSCLSY
jgi:hypothetical protein